MTKIRESMTTFFSVFAGVFVVYIVLDWGMDITGRRQNSRQAQAQEIGKINGEIIPLKEFSDLLRQAIDNQKTQSGTDPDDKQLRTIRDQVWSQLVEQKLFDEEVQRLSIIVPDKELVDWVRGTDPPEFLKRQFTDSTGTFDRQRYEATINDPRNKQIMVRVEDALRKQREREKLQSIINVSVQVPAGEVLQRFIEQNVKMEGDYISFDPNTIIKNEDITASDDELRKYYNDHSEGFKVEATRKLKYIDFSEAPSKKDSENVASTVEDIWNRASAGADFLDLAKTYSETPVNDSVWSKHGELGEEKENVIFGAKPDEILKPSKEFDGYHIIKVLSFRAGKDDFIRASHILIRINNNDSVSALKKAKEVYAAAKRGENFADLARKHSTDGSAANGGDLGWFGKGRMVKPFEEAAFKTKADQIVGPVRTQFGYHIIKVTARDNREVKFTDIHISVQISSQTKNDIEQRAQDFDYLAKQGDFLKEAAESKYNVSETPVFQKNASIPGVGLNSTLNKFAFSNKLGTVSDVITLQNGYGVYMISEVKEAGIRSFEELKANIDALVKREKKVEKTKALATELRQGAKPGDNLQSIAAKRAGLSVIHFPSFTMASGLPGIGRDLGLFGGLSSLAVGEISKPIEGSQGIFLIQFTSKTPFDSTSFGAQRIALHGQLLQEKRNKFLSDWTDHLKKSADIVDNRDLFYH